jgi:DNA-binding protein H-NS
MPKSTLQTIQKRIDALLLQAKRLKRKKTPVLRQIVNLMRAHSISLDEIRAALTGGRKRKSTARKKARRPTRKVAAMYRNPKTGETWSGRGRPARWLAAAEKAGKKRTEFLIKKS